MSKDLNVTTGELVRLAGKVQTLQNELNSRITSLNGVVDRIQAGWKGAAMQAYDATQANLNNRLRGVQRDLENLENLIKMAASGFDEQELERIRSFTSMEQSNPNQSAILGI
ncbi:MULTISPECIES: WXG100 family type VII secretion target [unclassified Streptomyces]|uniref:WXG100 family type VII secretion target n=1 Tax=unclassified Streptomyces TaxID=2593676 RepID=UPI0021C85E56|nr:WXG100 family type VII secretion target [Streptomyces sp. FIT100]UUN29515.1 WXG100 family type VII secretion target [Streptomyces sp. FIT100]